MHTKIYFNNQIFYNPTRKVISKILHQSSAYFEMSLYLMKTRLVSSILSILIRYGHYQTNNGASLIFKKNMVYLTLGGQITSLRDLNRLENIFEKSKYEVIMHYPTYPENVKKVKSFHRMLGAAWKKNL